MADRIIRAITGNGAVRAFAADTAALCNEARQIHQTTPVVTAALGRTLTAAAILGVNLKGDLDSLSVQIKGDGPIGAVVAVSDSRGRVRGYVHNNIVDIPTKANGKLDVGRAVGRGHITVIRDLGLREPYVGRVELQTGEIAEDLTCYLLHSEQVPSAVALGVLVDRDYSVKAAGGLILQMMPEATEKDVEQIEKNVSRLDSITNMLDGGMTCEDILNAALEGFEFEILDETVPAYRCNCSDERIYSVMLSLGREELESILRESGEAEIVCHFCGKKYGYDKHELEKMINS